MNQPATGFFSHSTSLNQWHSRRPHKRALLAKGGTIAEVFLNLCSKSGRFPACGDLKAGIATYSELKKEALLLADYLQMLPDVYIGILLPSCVDTFLCILACEIAGKVPVPIKWTLEARMLSYILEISKIDTILSSWAFLEKLNPMGLIPIEDKIILLEEIRQKITFLDKARALFRSTLGTHKILRIFNSDRIKPSNTALVLFAFDVEGVPKAVPLSHRNILKNLEGILSYMKFYTDDVFYNTLPPFHSLGITLCGLAPLLCGGRVVFSPYPDDEKKLAEIAEVWRVTLFFGTTNIVEKMMQVARPEQLRTIRLTAATVGKTPPSLLTLLEKRGKLDTLVVGYGAVECSPLLTVSQLGEKRRGVGCAIPGVKLMIVNKNTLAPLPIGKCGLILASGPNIFAGYLDPNIKSPLVELDSKIWYKTGDIGHLDAEGNLFIEDSIHKSITISTNMISLLSIEVILREWAEKKNEKTDKPCLAVCAKHSGQNTKFYLFTTIPTTCEEINYYLKKKGLVDAARISAIFVLNFIPQLSSGKINYLYLERTYLTAD